MSGMMGESQINPVTSRDATGTIGGHVVNIRGLPLSNLRPTNTTKVAVMTMLSLRATKTDGLTDQTLVRKGWPQARLRE